MNDDLKWLHRQNRAVRCKKHGLHYDPKAMAGCYLCLKEAPRRSAPSKSLFLLLAILGCSFALFQIFGKKPLPADSGFGIRGLPIEATEEDGLIDPESHRQTIRAFEDALFGHDRALSEPEQIQETVEARGATLLLEISRRDSTPAEELSKDLDEFLGLVRAQPVTTSRQGQLQAAWTQIRRRHFEDAPWLSEQDSSSSDSQDTARYSSAGADLEALLRSALSDAEALVGSEDSGAWKSFSRRFRTQLDTLIEQKPPRPRATADAQLLLAYQSFEAALRDSSSLARLSKPPSDIRQFSRALAAAEKASRAFDQARQ